MAGVRIRVADCSLSSCTRDLEQPGVRCPGIESSRRLDRCPKGGETPRADLEGLMATHSPWPCWCLWLGLHGEVQSWGGHTLWAQDESTSVGLGGGAGASFTFHVMNNFVNSYFTTSKCSLTFF